jgi:hypothetical protein
MPKLAGSFSARVNWQTIIPQKDMSGHEVHIMEIGGLQKSPDPLWNNARVSYWGISDMVEGNGTQHGYFINDHTDGSTDRGSFEARVAKTGSHITLEGTFRITAGTGKLTGITGNGTFQSRMVSTTEIETTWEGAYEVAEVKRGAGR